MSATVLPALFPVHRSKTIYLVRHGQAFHNVAGEKDHAAYMDPQFLDASLTDLGWKQAQNLRAHIATIQGGVPVDLVVVSPLMRALQTAVGVFGGELRGPPKAEWDGRGGVLMAAGAGGSAMGTISKEGCPPFVAVEMCREHLGRHPCDKRQGLGVYRKSFPGVDFSQVETDEDVWWSPDVRESTEDLKSRGLKFLQWVLGRKERSIAVVSHSSFLFHMLSHFGDDTGDVVKGEIRRGFMNCEMRSLILVDRSGLGWSHDNIGGGFAAVDFSGNLPPGPSAGSDLADQDASAKKS